MPATMSTVPTAHASRYLQQLCKHWSHKFETTFDASHGVVHLPDAELTLDAGPDALRLELTSADGAKLDRLPDVVADHIRRFAFREELDIAWVGSHA